MKIVVKWRALAEPPLLIMSIHHAPHRRQHVAMIQDLRDKLVVACQAAGVPIPIDFPIDLSVLFVNPTSPDFGNLYLALEQAMDEKTLRRPGILVDDSLVQAVTMSKMYSGGREEIVRQPLQLPRFSPIKLVPVPA